MNACIIPSVTNKTAIEKMARGIIASFLGMLVMACSGCGGGGGGSGQGSVAPAPTLKAVVIDAEGDSTMYGSEVPNGVSGRSMNPAPSVAQAVLRAQLGNAVTVENNAWPGTTVRIDLQGAPEFGDPLAPLATRLASDPAQIVIENFGINDVLIATPIDTFHSSLTSWVLLVRNMGKTPVLEEPNPVNQAGYEQLPAFVQMINQVASEQGVQVIQQYAYIQSLPNWQAMLTDGIHPNDALYQIKGQREATVLAPIVKALQ